MQGIYSLRRTCRKWNLVYNELKVAERYLGPISAASGIFFTCSPHHPPRTRLQKRCLHLYKFIFPGVVEVLAVLLSRCQREKKTMMRARKKELRDWCKNRSPQQDWRVWEQWLVKQRYPHIHWGVRNLLELFHPMLSHPSHTLLHIADCPKSMCHANSDSHMSPVSSKVFEVHTRHTPQICAPS